jgi:hypothetical protein
VGTNCAYKLIHASEAFLRLDTALQLEFVALLVPDLEPLVELPHEVRPDLVVDHSDKAPASVIRWVSDVDSTFSGLGVVGDTGWCDLILFELHSE